MQNIHIFQIAENQYEVSTSCGKIGIVRTSQNAFHTDNCYLSLFLDSYDSKIAHELFALFRAECNQPLQVMLDSDKQEQIDFLLAGGFQLKRRCYEVEATKEDLCISLTTPTEFDVICKGDPAYAECCHRVFAHYESTHREISRLTASYEEFCEELPQTVLCKKENGEITHLAFVEHDDEDYEIAYLHSNETDGFAAFGEQLLAHLADQAIRVFFECDDCDSLAMILRGFVKAPEETSYNTYVLK